MRDYQYISLVVAAIWFPLWFLWLFRKRVKHKCALYVWSADIMFIRFKCRGCKAIYPIPREPFYKGMTRALPPGLWEAKQAYEGIAFAFSHTLYLDTKVPICWDPKRLPALVTSDWDFMSAEPRKRRCPECPRLLEESGRKMDEEYRLEAQARRQRIDDYIRRTK